MSTGIGIDIGTSTISAVVFDLENKQMLASKTIINGCDLPPSEEGEHAQDAEKIVIKARGVLDELLQAYPAADRIGLTGQMHGITYLDENGKSISPLYTWQDETAGLDLPAGRSVIRELGEIGLHASAGYGIATYCRHLRTGSVPEGAASFCTIPDYLGVYLTGRRRPLQHISMAASMGCYDLRRQDFCRDELAGYGADLHLLPEVTQTFAQLGTYRGRPVTAALGDNQASFLGAVGLKPDTVLLNLGTGGQISMLVKEPVFSRDIESRPMTAELYLAAGSSLSGGRAYAALEKFFRAFVSEGGQEAPLQYERMARILEAEKPFRDPMQISTTFKGSRSDPSGRGSILHISEENFTPGNMIYGVLQGMCAELRGMFAQIETMTGCTIHSLVGSGNAIRKNPFLQEIAREQFGTDLTISPYEEEAACGAVLSTYGPENA